MASPRSKNRIEVQKVQAVTDGLTLADQLREKRISREAFAKRYAKLKESVIFENLTGLFTPYFFEVELKREIAIARRYQTPLCLMIVDGDGLKKINDTYGHTAGNKAISFLGKTILKHVREEDVPCRWGGDEFVVIFPYTELADALAVANRIKDLVRESEVDLGKAKIKLSISAGLAKFEMLDSPARLFKKADLAVYEVKRTGRGQIKVFSEEMIGNKGGL